MSEGGREEGKERKVGGGEHGGSKGGKGKEEEKKGKGKGRRSGRRMASQSLYCGALPLRTNQPLAAVLLSVDQEPCFCPPTTLPPLLLLSPKSGHSELSCLPSQCDYCG